jgi:MFS family permease
MSVAAASTRVHNLERSVQNPPLRAAFGLLAAVQVTLILAITVIAIGLPAVGRDLGLRPGELTLVSASYGLAFSGLLLLGGRLSDLHRPRRVLVSGLAVFALGSAAAGVAPGFGTLLAARLAQGTGAALVAPAAMALLGMVFPDRRRHHRALAVWGWLAPLGATSGLLLSGLVAGWASWRWGFALPTAVAVAAALAAPRLVPDGPPPARRSLDVPGALLATAGALAVSYGLVTAGDRGWSSAAVPVALVVGGLAVVGFLAVESRSRAPLLPLGFLRSRRRVRALTAALLAAAGHSTIALFLALYLQQVRGMSALATSAAFVPFALSLVATGVFAPRVVARLGARTATAAGLAVAAAGLLLIGWGLSLDTPYAGPLLAGLVVFQVGATLTFASTAAAAVDGADASERGLAAAVLNTAVELGASVGLAVLASLARAWTAHGADVASGYAFALTAAAAAFAIAAGLVALSSQPPTSGDNR